MKKIFVLLVFLFLITGCKAQYKIVINDDLSLTEEANLTGTQDFFDNYYKTTKKKVINSYLDIYKNILDANNYRYELINSDIPYVKVKKKYNDILDYTKNSILFNGYFDEVKYSENGNIKKLETIGYNYVGPDSNEDRFYVSDLEIAIKCPYKVTDHNAYLIDTKTNTYYYELTEKEGKILLEYDISRKFDPNSNLIRTIIISFVIIIIIWFTVFISNKNKTKKNK